MAHELSTPYRGNTHAEVVNINWAPKGPLHVVYEIGTLDGPPEVEGGPATFVADPDMGQRVARVAENHYEDFRTAAAQHALTETLAYTLLAFCDARGLLTPASVA
jgi:hypothetical protein